jgi:transglutaminase-like putative cysteine protease
MRISHHFIVRTSGIMALLLWAIAVHGVAKEDPKYIVKNIPAELSQNVDAVYWEDQLFFQIHSKSRATYRVFQAVTILNPNGKDHSQVVVGYDKLSKITSLKGAIYDATGKLVKRIKPSEIYDQSAYDGSLYHDNRLKAMDLSYGTYPYTVEFEYEVEYKYLFMIPSFVLLGDEKVASMHVEYTLTYPKELKPRYFTRNVTTEAEVKNLSETVESRSWHFKNVRPVSPEPMGPRFHELIPSIQAAPSNFEYDGYAGKMNTWDEFGLWINSLNKGRSVLPEKTKEEIQKITSAFDKPEEKIMAAYHYMQNRTRYVSIQLGIGGFQPFEASVVDQTGYGDCKALSNYMVSLLSTIGIKSHYVLIEAGRNPRQMNVDFPSSQFNHAVVCVPMEKDTIWLECTSQTNPFGYMGSFTGNRKALAITEQGAKIVRTPLYTENENQQVRVADVTIEANGNAIAKVQTKYAGLEFETDNLHFILDKTLDNQKKWVQDNTSIPTFSLNSFSLSTAKERIPSALLKMDLTLPRFASVSGKRLFLTPNLMNKSSFIPEKVTDRKMDVILYNAYTHIDTINYKISDQIYPEYLPESVKIESRFGSYEATFKVEQGNLVYARKFVRKNGRFPASTYGELTDFYKAVNKSDNVKIVFLNKT